MNKLDKALKRLSQKEKGVIKKILLLLNSHTLHGLNIKKLKGHDDIFRVRKGDLRILYRKRGDALSILAIERRSEKTYRDF